RAAAATTAEAEAAEAATRGAPTRVAVGARRRVAARTRGRRDRRAHGREQAAARDDRAGAGRHHHADPAPDARTAGPADAGSADRPARRQSDEVRHTRYRAAVAAAELPDLTVERRCVAVDQ